VPSPIRCVCARSRCPYLQFVDDIYKSDAYHSLSIEGYRASPELIERVRLGTWNPDTHNADQQNKDALAARGYWQAFGRVKESVSRIIASGDPGELVSSVYRDWYRELFQPCVVAGLIKPTALAGYRNQFVYIRRSRYVPPHWEVVPDAMTAYFELLEAEPEPSVRVVLGHWLFGYISLPGRQRPDSAVPDKCDAGLRRLPVDCDPGGGS
jgi:hypothetical protein